MDFHGKGRGFWRSTWVDFDKDTSTEVRVPAGALGDTRQSHLCCTAHKHSAVLWPAAISPGLRRSLCGSHGEPAGTDQASHGRLSPRALTALSKYHLRPKENFKRMSKTSKAA